MRSRIGSAALAAIVVVPFLAAPAAARKRIITIDNVAYSKTAVTVSKGEVVIWKDREVSTTHTVTSKGEDRFKSSRFLRAGDEHRVKFKQRGQYAYVCKIHPGMQGSITVK